MQKSFDHIHFSRIRDLVDFPLPENMEEITYVANATNFRRFMFNNFGKDEIDIDHEIATNPDTKLTYLGYRRFLESDLKYIFPVGVDRSNHRYKRDVKYLAKQMLVRGYVSGTWQISVTSRFQWLTMVSAGFCRRCRARFPKLPTSFHSSVYRRA